MNWHTNTSYSYCLNMLNLKLLKYRKVELDLMFMYKIIQEYVDLNFRDFFLVCHWNRICKDMIVQLSHKGDHVQST